VDVVISGHAHSFTNLYLPNAGQKPTLVTQAYSSGTAFGDIELTIDRKSHDVVEKSATIVHTFGDAGPGLHPAEDVAALVERAKRRVAPLVEKQVGEAARAISRDRNEHGESALGNLIADAQRAAVGADVAIMNVGGIRADLDAGPVTWGELFTVQPFANEVVRLELTGEELRALFEQQWSDAGTTRMLQVSGLRVTYAPERPAGSRIVSLTVGGAPLDASRTYSVAVNSFLAPGGDGFTVLARGRNRTTGPLDLEALTRFVESVGRPLMPTIDGRIERVR
jgi:5'-nucleotidase